MSQDPKEMLEQYRSTTTAQFRPLVDGFKNLSLAERDELLWYVSAYMTQQYAGLIREVQTLQQMIRSLGVGGPAGKPN